MPTSCPPQCRVPVQKCRHGKAPPRDWSWKPAGQNPSPGTQPMQHSNAQLCPATSRTRFMENDISPFTVGIWLEALMHPIYSSASTHLLSTCFHILLLKTPDWQQYNKHFSKSVPLLCWTKWKCLKLFPKNQTPRAWLLKLWTRNQVQVLGLSLDLPEREDSSPFHEAAHLGTILLVLQKTFSKQLISTRLGPWRTSQRHCCYAWTFNNLLFTPLPHHIIIICLVICPSTEHEFLEDKGPAFSSLYPKCHRASYTEVKYPRRRQTYKPTNTTQHRVLKSPSSHGSWFYSASINANMEGSKGLARP